MTVSVPAFQPFPTNPFPSTHMGLPANFLSRIQQPFPVNSQNILPNTYTTDDWSISGSSSQTTLHPCHYPAEYRDILDSDSKRLEHHLQSALEIAVKVSRMSSLAEILTPQAHTKLKALNILVHGDLSSRLPKDHSEFNSN